MGSYYQKVKGLVNFEDLFTQEKIKDFKLTGVRK